MTVPAPMRRRRSRLLLLASSAGAGLLAAGAAQALPTGGVVVGRTADGGGATIATSPSVVTVTQTSRRVVIDWNSFNVAQGETVNFNQGANNFIAFNRVNSNAGLTTINGAVNANGGVWLFAPGGMLFGPNARVNVGSFVGSTGVMATNFDDNSFSGNQARQPLTVEAGAQINAGAGFAALHSENLTMNGSVSASDAVLYFVAPGGSVTFQDQPSGPVAGSDAFTYWTTGQQNQPQMTHGGTTTAGTFVDIQSNIGDIAPGFQPFINVSGVIQASGVRNDGRSVIIAGSGSSLMNVNGQTIEPTGGTLIDTTGAQITAAGDIFMSGYQARLGVIDARALRVQTWEDIALNGAVSTTGLINLITSGSGGDIAVNADLRAGGSLFLTGSNISVGGGVTLQANADGVGGGTESLTINARRDVTAAATSLLIGGSSLAALTADVQITAGAAAIGGNMTVGGLAGRNVSLSGRSGTGGGGNILVAGPITAADRIGIATVQTGAPRGGTITVNGDLRAGGELSVYSADDGDIAIGSGLTLQSDSDGNGTGDLFVNAFGNTTIGVGTTIYAGASPNAPTRDVYLTAGGDNGRIPGNLLTNGTVAGRDVFLFSGGGNITVGGPVTALGRLFITSEVGSVPAAATITINAPLRSRGLLNIFNNNRGGIIVGPNLTLQSDTDGDGVGTLMLNALGGVTVDNSTVLLAGSSTSAPTAPVIIVAGATPTATGGTPIGGDVSVGSIYGLTVDVNGRSAPGNAADIRLNGTIFGLNRVRVITSAPQQNDARQGGSIFINGSVGSNGEVRIEGFDGGDVVIGATALLRGDADGNGVGNIYVEANRNISMAAGSQLIAGPGAGPATGAVEIYAGFKPTDTATYGGDIRIDGFVSGSSINATAVRSSTRGGTLSVGGDVLATGDSRPGADLELTVFSPDLLAGGLISVTGRLRSAGSLELLAFSGDVDVGNGAFLQSDTDGDGLGFLDIGAQRNLTTAATSTIFTGPNAASPTAAVRLFTGPVFSGRPASPFVTGDLISRGAIAGRSVQLVAFTGGNILVAGSILGTDSAQIAGAPRAGFSGGDIDLLAPVTSNGAVTITTTSGGDIRIGAVTVRSDANGDGVGTLTIAGNRNVTAAAGSLLVAGPLSGPGTAEVKIGAGVVPELGVPGAVDGGELTLGEVQGRTLTISAYRQGTAFGSLTLTGPLRAALDLTLLGDGAITLGTLQVGRNLQVDMVQGITVAGSLSAGGLIDLDAASGPITVNGSVVANGPISVDAGGAVTISPGASVRSAGALLISSGTTLTVGVNALLQGGYAGQAPPAAQWPRVVADPANGGVFLTAADIDLQGSVVSTGAGGQRGDIFILARGAATIGGAGSAGGFNLSDVEFQRLSGRNVVISGGGDLAVQDLTIDGSRVNELWLGTPAANRLTVAGSVIGAGSSRPNIRLGFVLSSSALPAPAATSGLGAPLPSGTRFIPSEVVISGSLGGAGALGQVSIVALGDVLMGSSDYVQAAQGNQDFDPDRQTSAPPATDHLFVQADNLQLAAGGRILQQNTAARGSSGGILVGEPSLQLPLILRYDDLTGSQSGGTSAATPGPSLISLNLSFRTPSGTLVSGRDVARAPGLLAPGDTGAREFRVNGCVFGASACGDGSEIPVFQNPVELSSEATQTSEELEASTQSFLSVPDEEEEEERQAIGLPVTGSGNAAIWVKPERSSRP